MSKSVIEVTNLSKDYCEFTLRHSTLSIANALRRIMIAEIPIMAIDEVLVYDNNSVMIDEFLAHRLGLVPLVSEQCSQFLTSSECTCVQGCDRCCVSFKLDVKNTEDTFKLITTRDLEPFSNPLEINDPGLKQAIRSVVPATMIGLGPEMIQKLGQNVNHDIVLTKLGQNQTIQLLCKARKGTGKQHSKWSPVCTAVFSHQPRITVDKAQAASLDHATQQQISNSCPTRVFSVGTTLDIEDQNKCMFCKECVKACTKAGKPSLISITTDPTVFHFTVETTGSLTPEQVIQRSIQVLKKKLQSVRI